MVIADRLPSGFSEEIVDMLTIERYEGLEKGGAFRIFRLVALSFCESQMPRTLIAYKEGDLVQ